MKLVFLDASTLGSDISLKEFEEFGEVSIYDTTKPEETLKRVQDADIVITNKVVIDKHIMQQSNIKLICVAATGMNNIDLEYAWQNKIIVKNAVGYSTDSVVQLTFAMVFHFLQNIPYFDNYYKSGQWEQSEIFTHVALPFQELAGKDWGIIGLGTIGKKVANIAKSFGCNVYYYSTSGSNFDTDYNNVSLEYILKQSDIISVHSPLNQETNNLLNISNLHMIQEKAILLNLGRGGIINEKDLAQIIDQKELCVGLDVVSKEPITKDNPLNFVTKKSNLLITPHIAWASTESRKRLVDCIIKNISEYVK